MKPNPLRVVEDADPVRTEAAARFARLHGDELSEADLAAHEAWLAADPSHRLAFERVERTWLMLSDFAAAPEISQRLAAIPAAAPPANATRQHRPRRLR